jgi:NADH-quinone oxidoreductase subunit L
MAELFAIKYSWLIPALPLLAAALIGLIGARVLKGQSHWPVWIAVGIGAVLSISLLIGMLGIQSNYEHGATIGMRAEASTTAQQFTSNRFPLTYVQTLFTWIEAGDPAKSAIGKTGSDHLSVSAGFFFDPLTAVMLCVVCGIGFLITVFAAGYMKGEEGYYRFFAYVALFITAMTLLVMGDNLILLYLGWEGVGLCSYLLIGYYYDTPVARDAAKKAFIVNRIGDFGFAVAVMLGFLAFGTVSYYGDGAGSMTGLLDIATKIGTGQLTPFQEQALYWMPFLLMLGAFGKSAQFPLFVWLPDAMAGPTPVSALIHAATMVTAGVYMCVRCGAIFYANEAALITLGVVGCFTAVFAGTIAFRQYDLKKVFAYSTVSQLGFMFVAVAVLAPVAAIFHLATHAFFKALLFLSSGVVMHATHGELDMRKMSGLRRYLPVTRWLMLIGCLALAGVPLTSGFFSKDEILASSMKSNVLLGAIMMIAALMTAYYTFRVYFRVFEGPEVIPAPGGGGHGAGHNPLSGHGPDVLTVSALHGLPAGHSSDGHGSSGAHGGDHDGHHNHEPLIMIAPLAILAVGSIFAFLINFPGHNLATFLGASPSLQHSWLAATANTFKEKSAQIPAMPFGQTGVQHERENESATNPQVKANLDKEHSIHWMMMGGSAVFSLLGIGLAWRFHLKDRSAIERISQKMSSLVKLLEGKYWVDEIYDAIFVKPLRAISHIFAAIDQWVIDGVVFLAGLLPRVLGGVLRLTTQRGNLQGYAAGMIFGIAVILLVIFL